MVSTIGNPIFGVSFVLVVAISMVATEFNETFEKEFMNLSQRVSKLENLELEVKELKMENFEKNLKMTEHSKENGKKDSCKDEHRELYKKIEEIETELRIEMFTMSVDITTLQLKFNALQGGSERFRTHSTKRRIRENNTKFSKTRRRRL